MIGRLRCLSPIAWVVNGVRGDVESFAQRFDKHLQSLYLAIGWVSDSSVSNEADADGPAGPVPGLAGVGRQLLFPFLRRLYFAFATAEAVAQTEVTIDIFGPRQTVQRGQLFYAAGSRAAVVNLDAVPPPV